MKFSCLKLKSAKYSEKRHINNFKQGLRTEKKKK